MVLALPPCSSSHTLVRVRVAVRVRVRLRV